MTSSDPAVSCGLFGEGESRVSRSRWPIDDVDVRTPGQERAHQTAERVAITGGAIPTTQPPSPLDRQLGRRSKRSLCLLAFGAERSRRSSLFREQPYSPLARDVEVDDLALVVDHGGLGWRLKEGGKEREQRRKKGRESSESAAAAEFFFFFLPRPALAFLCSPLN